MLHDYAARLHDDLVPVLPGSACQRSYWLVAHDDVRDLARVRLVSDYIVELVAGMRRSSGKSEPGSDRVIPARRRRGKGIRGLGRIPPPPALDQRALLAAESTLLDPLPGAARRRG